jgi:genome maintenance exonuclease 1
MKFKFDYPTVVYENTTENGRVYFVRDNNGVLHEGLYSVTTILSSCMDSKAAIEQWRNTVGHKFADELTKRSTDRGSMMHDILYYRLINEEYKSKFKPNFMFAHAEKMADTIQKYITDNLDELWGAEVPLILPPYYAGRTDCVGIYKGKQSIVDFKNSYKEKKEEYMESYFLQCAAYALSHDYLFGTNIDQAVILICNSDDISAREIIVSGNEFLGYKHKWMDMFTEFHKR